MPIPLAALAIGGAAVGAMGSYAQQKSQERQNALDRQFSEIMYQRQRQDALSDWDMVNKFNSPQQTMQRFKEAGLNSHLVYGNAAYNAPAIKSTDFQLTKQTAPTFDTSPIQNSIGMFADAQIKEVQTDNMQLQNDLLAKQALLTTANIAKVGLDNDRSALENKKAQALYDTVIDTAQTRLEDLNVTVQGKKQNIMLDLNRYQLEKLKTSTNVAYTLQQMGIVKQMAALDSQLKTQQLQTGKLQQENIKEDVLTKKQQQQINAYDALLLEKGYSRDSPWYLKNMGLFINNLLDLIKN